VLVGCAALTACSQGPRQDVSEPTGNFPVQITEASFPSTQTLSEHTNMVITVRNAGHKAIPNVNVEVCNVTCAYPAPPGEGTSSIAFASNEGESVLSSTKLPVWIVDKTPGLCGYSCEGGGGGGAGTAYDNTWSLGRLQPGRTATFRWGVTAVGAGRHVVAWRVQAGLNGKAQAVLSGGGRAVGSFAVTVSQAPAQSHVNDAGQIVRGQSVGGTP
jgi:hypothetical protein